MTPCNRVRGAAAAVVAAALLTTGCGSRDHPAPREETPVRVSVIRAGRAADLPLVLPARVTAREEVTLTARLAARLTGLDVREGDAFRAGQTLAVFDAPETRGARDAARAAFVAASLARDLARKQEARLDSLYAARVAALRELETARAERQAAEAAAAQASAQMEEVQSAVALAAPFDGVVVRRRVDPGETVGPGQPILDLRSRRPGAIAASVPESELDRLASGGCAYQIDDGPWLPAILFSLDGMTDEASRSRVARFRPVSPAPLDPGAFARVRLDAASTPAAPMLSGSLTLPSAALVRRGGLTGTFVVEGGVARMRWLRIGRESAGQVEVLAGLEPSEAVVANPAGLLDGRRVVPAP